MANDAKIRLQITTALDAAGIKATQAQIDEMAKHIKSANGEIGDGFGRLENALGKIPGRIGKITGAIGGVTEKIGLMFGAFQQGFELGDKLRQKMIEWIPALRDSLETEDEYYARIEEQGKRTVAALDRQRERTEELYRSQQELAESAIKRIDDEAAAYNRAHRAKMEYLNAGADAEIQQLERERFEDIMQLQAAGDEDAVKQANALYDIYRAELQMKKQLAAADENALKFEAERWKLEERAAPLQQKIVNAEERLAEAKAERQKLESDAMNDAMSADQMEGERRKSDRRIRSAQKELDELNEKANSLLEEDAVNEADAQTAEIRRATLADRLNMERDRAAMAYDKTIDETGNALGLTFDEDYIKRLNESSEQSYNQLLSINQNTQSLSDKLDELLGMKGGE